MTKRRKILAVFASMAILTSVVSTTAFAATPEKLYHRTAKQCALQLYD